MPTALGEALDFTVRWPGHTPAEIRTLLDWEIAYALRTVPGVVEVNAWGGDTGQVDGLLRPAAELGPTAAIGNRSRRLWIISCIFSQV